MQIRFKQRILKHLLIHEFLRIDLCLGKFAHYNIAAPRIVSFLLSTRVSSKINGTGVQCLTYYYYLPNITGTQQSIRVIKQEVDNLNNVTLDTVSNNFFNGWSKRQIDYNAEKRGYEVTIACRSMFTTLFLLDLL